jgi:hypothetical protein
MHSGPAFAFANMNTTKLSGGGGRSCLNRSIRSQIRSSGSFCFAASSRSYSCYGSCIWRCVPRTRSSFADISPTSICMHCHSQMWAAAPAVAGVRESYRTNLSIQWTRVYNLPQYVYFDHSIHVHKGIGCATCHGRVDRMPLTWQAPHLTMAWCLDCHRNPEKYVLPKSEVFSMSYSPPANQADLDARLVKEYKIRRLTTSCRCLSRGGWRAGPSGQSNTRKTVPPGGLEAIGFEPDAGNLVVQVMQIVFRCRQTR